jgi:hypothetical protein
LTWSTGKSLSLPASLSSATSVVGAVAALAVAAANASRVELERCSRHAQTMPPVEVMPT